MGYHFIKTIMIIGSCWVTSLFSQNTDLYNVTLRSGLVNEVPRSRATRYPKRHIVGLGRPRSRTARNLLIKCELVNIIPDSVITIKQYGTISMFKCRDVLSIVHSGSKVINNDIPLLAPGQKIIYKKLLEKKWTNGIQVGFNVVGAGLLGTSVGTQMRFNTLKGLNKRIEAGFSVGFDPYMAYKWIFASVMGEARYYFIRDTMFSPIIYMQAGYGFNLSAVAIGKDGGINGALGFGKSIRTMDQKIFTIMCGAKIQSGDNEHSSGFSEKWKMAYAPYIMIGLELKLEWRF